MGAARPPSLDLAGEGAKSVQRSGLFKGLGADSCNFWALADEAGPARSTKTMQYQ
jgi:hypothetical protein